YSYGTERRVSLTPGSGPARSFRDGISARRRPIRDRWRRPALPLLIRRPAQGWETRRRSNSTFQSPPSRLRAAAAARFRFAGPRPPSAGSPAVRSRWPLRPPLSQFLMRVDVGAPSSGGSGTIPVSYARASPLGPATCFAVVLLRRAPWGAPSLLRRRNVGGRRATWRATKTLGYEAGHTPSKRRAAGRARPVESFG